MPLSQRLQVGFVLRAHGVRGGLRLRAQGDAVLALERLFIAGRAYRVLHAQRERDDLLVQLEGVTDRDQAEALKGAAVEAARDDLPPPEADEHYVADLVGCRVFDTAGQDLGEVVGSFDSGAHETLVVRGAREFMLPFVDAIVTGVDVEARRIVCDPPPGLIDLDEAD